MKKFKSVMGINSFLVILGFIYTEQTLAQPRPMKTQQAANPEPKAPSSYKLYQEKPQKPLGLYIDLHAGSATFQDIQAPVSQTTRLRIDGTDSKEDSLSHKGILIGAQIGWKIPHKFGSAYSALSGARASSSTPVNAPTASYSKLGLNIGSEWTLTQTLGLLTEMELRRSSFKNTDNGHYVDALMFNFGSKIDIQKVELSGKFGFSGYSQLGYSQATGSGRSGTLANTNSSLSEWQAKLAYNLNSEASLHIMTQQENIDIQMNDLSGYRRLGFSVMDDGEPNSQRQLRLSTTVVGIGATKKF